MNKRWMSVLSVLGVITLLLAGCQGGPTAEEIVAKIREVEASTEDVHAVIEVAVDVESEDLNEELVVEVWEKSPNKLRAEVLESSRAELVGVVSVTDGAQGWMYHPGENVVAMGDAGPEGVPTPREAVQFVQGVIERVLDTSEVELMGQEDVAGVATYKLAFTPNEEGETVLPPGSEATLWVEQERWIVRQAHFRSDLLGEGRMRVRTLELNQGLSDALFQFEIPAGAEVIEVKDVAPAHMTLDEAQAEAEFLRVPGYVPAGATLIDVFTVGGEGGAYVLRYNHAATAFTVVQGYEAMGELPEGPRTEVTVRGQPATLITDEAQGNSFLTWEEDGIVISIAGHIGADEVVKVAESLQ